MTDEDLSLICITLGGVSSYVGQCIGVMNKTKVLTGINHRLM